jgi:hypothetical protein
VVGNSKVFDAHQLLIAIYRLRYWEEAGESEKDING